MIGWFRVPPWCLSVHDEESAPRARAWVYLLGAWDAGDDPPTREVRRVTGFGQGRADTLVRDVAAWAIENGARLPARVAEQHRSRSGAGAEQADKGTTPKAKQHRSGVGAASEQDRSVSRARFLFQGEETVDVDADEDSAPASGAAPLTADAHPLANPGRHGCTRADGKASPAVSVEPSPTQQQDEPPTPTDEDYYASETMDGLPAFDAVNGLLDGAHRGDGPEADRCVEGAPPAPQRRTAAVDAGGANEGRGPRSGATLDQLAGGGSGVSGDAVRRTGGVVVRGGGVRDLTPGLFGALNGASSASTGASHATAPAEGVAGKGGASGHVAAWVPTGRAAKGYDPAAIEAMVLHGLAEMRAAPDKAGKRQRATIKPDRCGTDAATILNLWTKLGAPPPEEMAADLAAVAEWAQCSPDPLAARNIRAEGWDAGTNRCRHVKTLCVQEAWGDRLDAAHRWIEKGRPLTLKREEPIKPVAEPGSDQQPFEDFMAYNYRIDREIKRGIRDFKGNVLPTHLRLVANHG